MQTKKMIPFYKQQTKYTCGPATMRMILALFKIKKSEKSLTKIMKTSKNSGTKNQSFLEIFKLFHLSYVTKQDSSISDLKRILNQKRKIIVGYYLPYRKQGHYAIVQKITKNKIFLIDPWYGPNHHYKISEFLRIWHNDPKGDKGKRWFIAIKKTK